MSAVSQKIVEARDVTKHFGQICALKGVDLSVAEKELVFIIGPSGSGKSTFLRCLNRLEEPDRGSILVDGTQLMDPRVNINAIRRRIGMVFQSFNLYPHMTALQNVTLALRKVLRKSRAEADEIGRAALARVHLGERAAHYPAQLSGGQQQRVAIARSIALSPRVMLFDEPTSALDPELVGGVLNVMKELRGWREAGGGDARADIPAPPAPQNDCVDQSGRRPLKPWTGSPDLRFPSSIRR